MLGLDVMDQLTFRPPTNLYMNQDINRAGRMRKNVTMRLLPLATDCLAGTHSPPVTNRVMLYHSSQTLL